MKVCPICGEVYPDRELSCRAHDTGLLDWAETTASHNQLDPVTDVDRRPIEPDHPFELGYAAGEIALTPTPVRVARAISSDTPRVELRGDSTQHQRAPHGGRVLAGRYRLGEHIGIGGYGAVFDAIDDVTGERVAVKVLSPAAAQSAELITRFHREAIAASRVEHRHIVDVKDFDVDDDGTHFIVMEYLDGGDLSEQLDDNDRLPPVRALAIAAQCASALAAAHRAGILHRDLKPANLFLVKDETHPDFIKIIDFGISKLTRAAGNYADLTRASKVVGTPCYMSPEQARGEKLDGRCDVYGLGVILYELLTGSRPFIGRSTIEVLTNHIKGPRIPPSHLNPELAVHPEIDGLVLRAIAARPGDRYQSMEEFGDAILGCLAAMDPTAPARLFGSATARPFSELSSDITRVHEVPGPPGRRSLLLPVAGAIAVVAVVAVVLLRGGDDDDTATPAARAPEVATAAPVAPAAARHPAPEPARPPVASERPPPPRASNEPAVVPATPDARAPDYRVQVTSRPTGATVYRDGRKLGTTPLQVTIEAGQAELELTIRSRGRQTRSLTVGRQRAHEHVVLPAIRRSRRPTSSSKVGIEEW